MHLVAHRTRWWSRLSIACFVACATLFALSPSTSFADIIATVTIDDGLGPVVVPVNLIALDQDGNYGNSIPYVEAGRWSATLTILATVNFSTAALFPGIGLTFTPSASARDVTVTVDLPVDPLVGQINLTSGAAQVTAAAGGVSTIGTDPFYMAQIDGSDYQSLLAAPISLTFPSNTITSVDSFGPTVGPDVNSSISIVWKHQVDGGPLDLSRVSSLNANFVIQRVPEPSTVYLAGSGIVTLLGTWVYRRRVRSRG